MAGPSHPLVSSIRELKSLSLSQKEQVPQSLEDTILDLERGCFEFFDLSIDYFKKLLPEDLPKNKLVVFEYLNIVKKYLNPTAIALDPNMRV